MVAEVDYEIMNDIEFIKRTYSDSDLEDIAARNGFRSFRQKEETKPEDMAFYLSMIANADNHPVFRNRLKHEKRSGQMFAASDRR